MKKDLQIKTREQDAVLTSGKNHLNIVKKKPKKKNTVIKNKESHYIMIKESIQQNGIIIINISASNVEYINI